ncbi:glycogen biosynthesis protein GlgD [Clostridium acetireducens DSM 10703]|jgi:glucose-1-phosphate adenylyltransferase|uniref:Glycogen biosynthesis protein GlgD n=1 Tax=Clostridium acetireducens DSM 10703 TaxID=1121290 RepID=A0A1E8F0S4_9CLOT|nr:glucose-1-phosphate adenylyltransferase subunit GlgD [Clostridium acetireducens]OFI06765.1 glycogen biosynthesis protein GlgD [Clostridium acetireducens DSM 10703]
MKNVLGIINNLDEESNLKEITANRSIGAVPFGGRYRLIDFILSNMINSGVQNVGVLLQNNARSVMAHLRSGKEWGLDRKINGLNILPPNSIKTVDDIPKGDLENFYANIDYFSKASEKYVIVCSSNFLFNMDFKKVLKHHIEKNADITIIYKDFGKDILNHNKKTIMETDKLGRVFRMEVNPQKAYSSKESMEVYLMEKYLLVDLINRCISRGVYNFKTHCIIHNLRALKVYGYEYKGYVANIDSVKNYYKYNMDLLNVDIATELFTKEGLIYTSVKDQPPVKYMETAQVKNSLIANGSIIAGNVENSIISRGVKVEKGAYVKDSIIMENSLVQQCAKIENVILDKEVTITKNMTLIGGKYYPLIIEKKAII